MLNYQALKDAHPVTDDAVPTTGPHSEHDAAAAHVPSAVNHAGVDDMSPQAAMMAFMQSVAKTRFPPSRNNRTQSPSVQANRWMAENRNGVRYGAVNQAMPLFRQFQKNHPELLAEYDRQHDHKLIPDLDRDVLACPGNHVHVLLHVQQFDFSRPDLLGVLFIVLIAIGAQIL